MPPSVQIRLLILGGVRVLMGLVGGNFKLFGAEFPTTISNRFLRFVAFLFGTVLIIAALQQPQASSQPPSPSPSPPSPSRLPPNAKVDQFVGRWVNENRDTDGITRVEIQRRLNTLSVHMWGKCHPTDCDWGTTTTDVSDSDDGILSITWQTSFKEEKQEVSILPDRRIQVVSHTHFTDSSGRPDYHSTYYFVRE